MTVDVNVDLTTLYHAIIAKVTGRQVSQAGHKDKQTSFANAPLTEMIRLYRMLWTKASGLPELNDLGQPVVKRGPPARFYRNG